jgi:hypothetical protein
MPGPEDATTDTPLLRLLAPHEHAEFKMTFGGDGRSLSTRAIPLDRLHSPYTLEVSYKDGVRAQLEDWGRYALDLAKMLEAGLVRLESQKGREVVRLIVQQRGDDLYVQLNQTSPHLRLPRP